MLCRWRCFLLFFIPDFSLFMDSLYVCTMGIIIEDLMLIKLLILQLMFFVLLSPWMLILLWGTGKCSNHKQ